MKPSEDAPDKPYSCGHLPAIGDRVQLTEAALGILSERDQRKFRDQVGLVKYFAFFHFPVVVFPTPAGTKGFNGRQCHADELRLVSRAEPKAADAAIQELR